MGKNELITIVDGVAVLDAVTASRLEGFERQMKFLKEREDELKAALLEEMEAKGVIGIKTDNMTVTYVPESDREKFDGKKFRADSPETYDLYVSMVPVKASLRIRVK